MYFHPSFPHISINENRIDKIISLTTLLLFLPQVFNETNFILSGHYGQSDVRGICKSRNFPPSLSGAPTTGMSLSSPSDAESPAFFLPGTSVHTPTHRRTTTARATRTQ